MDRVSLPVEMLQAIVHEIPETAVDDLLALRLVDRTFHSIVKVKAFRYLRIRNTPTGARRVLDFLESLSELIGVVEKIRVTQPETEEEEENYFTGMLVGTPKFPAVRSFEVNLPETVVLYQHIHMSLLHTLLNLAPPSIQSLTLTNWIPKRHDYYLNHTFGTYPVLSSLWSSLKELYIVIRSYDYIDPLYLCLPFIEPWRFWQRFFPDGILSPTQATLTSLTLASDMHVSLSHIFLESLFFPHLETLSFRGIPFSLLALPYSNMEQFIVKHHRTLKHLELHKCAIVRTAGFFRSWEEVWLYFAAELDRLHELVVDEFGSLYHERICRYRMKKGESGFLADEEISVHWDWEAEADALETLKVMVESRRALRVQ